MVEKLETYLVKNTVSLCFYYQNDKCFPSWENTLGSDKDVELGLVGGLPASGAVSLWNSNPATSSWEHKKPNNLLLLETSSII